MATRGVGITISYVAWDTANNVGKTGDNANHTLRWIKDGTSSAPTNSISEVDSTNAPGVYKITLTASEAGCDYGTLAGVSSTADISIIPVSVQFERLPDAAPGASGGVPTVDGNNRVAGIQGTKNDLDDLNDVSTAEVNTECDTAISDAALATASALATVDSNVDAILADTGTDGVVLSTATIQAIADGLLDRTDGVEPSSGGTERTVREALRIILSACAGKASGLNSTEAIYRDTNDTKARITATVDADGNRTAVTLDDS